MKQIYNSDEVIFSSLCLFCYNDLFFEYSQCLFYFISIDDPLKKNATIGFINNFGQIPKQLFRKAHPSKKMSQRSSTILDPNIINPTVGITPPEKLFFHNLDNLKPTLQPVKGLTLFKFISINWCKSLYFCKSHWSGNICWLNFQNLISAFATWDSTLFFLIEKYEMNNMDNN